MFSENQLVPISALQHLIFCERQCALIHVEQLWAENRLTVEGNILHKKTHEPKHETIEGVRIARSLWLKSHRLGLVGQADVVEFHNEESCSSKAIIPVEYKRGKPKKDDSDRVQICAQALCLEEMLERQVERGFLFYGKRKRRTEVIFDEPIRKQTEQHAARLHQMIAERRTPPAFRHPKCDQCSLLNLCLPDSMRFKTGASAFLQRQLSDDALESEPITDDFMFIE